MSVANPVIDYFDTASKRIYLLAGVTKYHTVTDIYVEMRYRRRVDESLRPFDRMITAEGNKPKGGSKFTSRYSIFNHGWRIVPTTGLPVLDVEGEQITDDGQSGPQCIDFTLLPPGTSIVVNYEPPASELVRADAEIAAISKASYGGSVHIDANGSAGTAFPLGTGSDPINNLADAKTVALALGVKVLLVNGLWTFGATDNIDGWHIKAATHEAATITLAPGCSTVGAVFEDVVLTGTCGGECHLIHCNIPPGGLYEAEGEHLYCTYRGDVHTAADADLEILDSWSAMSGFAHPELVCNGNVAIGIRNYSGGFGVVGLTGGSVTFGINTGNVHVHNTCTGGSVTLRGTGTLADESAGATVESGGFVNSDNLIAATTAAVLAALNMITIPVDMRKVKGQTIGGAGTEGSPWGPT